MSITYQDLEPDEVTALQDAEEHGPRSLCIHRRREIIWLFKFYADGGISTNSLCGELRKYTREEIEAARYDFRDMGTDYWTPINIKKW